MQNTFFDLESYENDIELEVNRDVLERIYADGIKPTDILPIEFYFLTDAEIVKQYFFGTNVVTDWKKGSPIFWRGEWEGKTYEDKGEILDIDPGKYVKYNYWSSMGGTEDKPENYVDVSYSLAEQDGKTVLTIGQERIKTVEAKEHSESNWQFIFGKMKEMVESNEV